MPQNKPIELEEIAIANFETALYAITLKYKSGLTKALKFGARLERANEKSVTGIQSIRKIEAIKNANRVAFRRREEKFELEGTNSTYPT